MKPLEHPVELTEHEKQRLGDLSWKLHGMVTSEESIDYDFLKDRAWATLNAVLAVGWRRSLEGE